MSATTLALTIEMPLLVVSSSWHAFQLLAVQMAKDLPRQGLAAALDEVRNG